MEKKSVLVVDDSQVAIELLKSHLNSFGLTEIETANNVNAAFATLVKRFEASRPIDLVLCDWTMPGPTGQDLLLQLRHDTRFKYLPFVLVTSQAAKSIVLDALNSGAQGYVYKPVDPSALKRAIEKALDGKKA
ncbi:MAG: response regulator [Bdellovibrionaceae bacterium]|nr:response regulator [Pseudobdellovibrionaceae bacterium]